MAPPPMCLLSNKMRKEEEKSSRPCGARLRWLPWSSLVVLSSCGFWTEGCASVGSAGVQKRREQRQEGRGGQPRGSIMCCILSGLRCMAPKQICTKKLHMLRGENRWVGYRLGIARLDYMREREGVAAQVLLPRRPYGGRTAAIQRPYRGHTSSYRGHTGAMQGPYRGHTGAIQGPYRAIQGPHGATWGHMGQALPLLPWRLRAQGCDCLLLGTDCLHLLL